MQLTLHPRLNRNNLKYRTPLRENARTPCSVYRWPPRHHLDGLGARWAAGTGGRGPGDIAAPRRPSCRPTSPFLPPRALPCGFSHAVGSVACVVPVPPAGIGAFQGQEPRLLVLFVISALEQVRENCGRGSDPRLSVGADSSIPHRNCQEADPLLEERGVLAGFSGPRDPPFALLQPGPILH